MLSLSYGVLSVKFAVYCIIKLRPMLIFHCTPSYWLSHFNPLKMVPFIILTERCHVDVFWTGLKKRCVRKPLTTDRSLTTENQLPIYPQLLY